MQLKHAFGGIQRERGPQTPSFWEDRREENSAGLRRQQTKKLHPLIIHFGPEGMLSRHSEESDVLSQKPLCLPLGLGA